MALDEILNDQNRNVDKSKDELIRRLAELQSAAINMPEKEPVISSPQQREPLTNEPENQNPVSEDNV